MTYSCWLAWLLWRRISNSGCALGRRRFLASKDSKAIIAVGKKITDFLNERRYECPTCGQSSWEFSGYRDAEIISGSRHKQELSAAFQNVKKELYIASGYISSHVVDLQLLKQLKEILENEIAITLIFSGSASHTNFMTKDTPKVSVTRSSQQATPESQARQSTPTRKVWLTLNMPSSIFQLSEQQEGFEARDKLEAIRSKSNQTFRKSCCR